MKPLYRSVLASSIVALTLGSNSAWAGDPCPIGFALIDMGVPEWASKELKQKVEHGDSFIDKLVAVAKKQECTEVYLDKVKAETLPLKVRKDVKADLTMATVRSAVFKQNRGFECSRAAKSLKALDEAAERGVPVLFLRGHKRILVVVAGWHSTCISSAEADAMSEKELLRFWTDLTKSYVTDRHANP